MTNPDIVSLAASVAIITSALSAVTIAALIYGPDILSACRDLFRPRYVVRAREHNIVRICATPRAHENEAVRRARLEMVENDAVRRAQAETVRQLNLRGYRRLH